LDRRCLCRLRRCGGDPWAVKGGLLGEPSLRRVDDGQDVSEQRNKHRQAILDAPLAARQTDDERPPFRPARAGGRGRVDDAGERVGEGCKGRLDETVGCQGLGERRELLGEERGDGLRCVRVREGQSTGQPDSASAGECFEARAQSVVRLAAVRRLSEGRLARPCLFALRSCRKKEREREREREGNEPRL
jgi:hypothetical protein